MRRDVISSLGGLVLCLFVPQLFQRDIGFAVAEDIEFDDEIDLGDDDVDDLLGDDGLSDEDLEMEDEFNIEEDDFAEPPAPARNKQIKAVFVNKQKRSVVTWWINPDTQQPSRLGQIEGEASFTLNSFPGHKIVLTEDENFQEGMSVLAEFTTTEEDAQTHIFTVDGKAVSLKEGGAVKMEIRNKLDLEVHVLWKNPDTGGENLITQIASGKVGSVNSFVHHMLRVRDGPTNQGKLLREIEVGVEPMQSIVLAEDGDDEESDDALSDLELEDEL